MSIVVTDALVIGVIGATTANAGEPRDRAMGPADLLATIYHAVGIDPHATLPNREGRPVPLVPAGNVVRELF